MSELCCHFYKVSVPDRIESQNNCIVPLRTGDPFEIVAWLNKSLFNYRLP